MTPEQKLKIYSEQELTDIILYIDKFQSNIAVLTDTIIARVHELNVSSKKNINISKEECLEILKGFVQYSHILNQIGAWTDITIREMVPSLRLANTLGPMYLEALRCADVTNTEPIVHKPNTE